VSFESAALGNGAFTAELKRVLSRSDRRTLGIDELRASVSAGVARLTGDQQHPTLDHDNPDARLLLPTATPSSTP
jgi:hypothetical protein